MSYTLNNGPRPVSTEARRRVEEAVATLGYQPNEAARALKRGKSELIALIVPDIGNLFFAEMTQHIEVKARDFGRTILVLESTYQELANSIQSLAGRQLDGLIVAMPIDRESVVALDALGAPVVLLEQDGPLNGLDAFGVDLYQGARLAVSHLVEHGHTSIGYVGPPLGPRKEGWVDALESAGLAVGPEYLAAFSRSSAYAAGQRLAYDRHRPSAVFISTDNQATGVLRAVHEAGLGVPGDLAIVSFDGTKDSEYSWPPVTTVAQPLQRVTEDAVESLLGGRSERGGFRRYPVEVIRRTSCGC